MAVVPCEKGGEDDCITGALKSLSLSNLIAARTTFAVGRICCLECRMSQRSSYLRFNSHRLWLQLKRFHQIRKTHWFVKCFCAIFDIFSCSFCSLFSLSCIQEHFKAIVDRHGVVILLGLSSKKKPEERGKERSSLAKICSVKSRSITTIKSYLTDWFFEREGSAANHGWRNLGKWL